MKRKVDPLIWVLSLAWTAIWGGLGVSAIVLKSLSMSTRYGLSHHEGLEAVMRGAVLIGVALAGGALPFLHRNRFRKHIIALMVLCWLVGSAVLYASLR
jgi:hypothetical protein